MLRERYSIEVSDEMVVIHGYLSIREAFDFLSFFDQQGYSSVMPGEENSSLCLMKKKVEEFQKDLQESCDSSELKLCKNELVVHKAEIERLKTEMKEKEIFAYKIYEEHREKYRILKESYEKLSKEYRFKLLSENLSIQEMTSGKFTLVKDDNPT